MSELRKRFIETLTLHQKMRSLGKSPTFVAMGAAIFAEERKEQTLADLLGLHHGHQKRLAPSDTLEPLFHNEEELAEFRNRHAQATQLKKTAC